MSLRSHYLKKLLILLMLGSMLLLLVAPAVAQGNPTATVNTGALNVRNGPNYTYDSVAVIYRGAQVTLLGRFYANHWVRIRLINGTEGWVNSNYLLSSVPINSLPVIGQPPGGPPGDGSGPPPPGQGGNPTATVNTGALNVRSGPGINFGIVGRVTNGETVAMLGRAANSSWIKIRTAGAVEGWVNSNYLRTSVPIGNLPVIAPGGPGGPGTGGQPVGTINTGALNVRGGPGLAYAVITVAYQGQTVSLLGRNENSSWLLIRLPDGGSGWVNASLVQTSANIGSLPIMETPPPATRATVTSGALNVRYGPGVNFDSFATLTHGTVVGLIGRNPAGTWVKIQTPNGGIGWVNAAYLNPSVPIMSLPILY